MNEQDDYQQVALDAVSDLIQTLEPGSMVTRFVLIAEVVDPDNRRVLWTLNPPDSKPWDTLGLCAFATSLENAATTQQEDQ